MRGDVSFRKQLYSIVRDMIYYAEKGDEKKVRDLNIEFEVLSLQAFSSTSNKVDTFYDNVRQQVLFYMDKKSMFHEGKESLRKAKEMFLKLKKS